jgi:hypothetical protein
MPERGFIKPEKAITQFLLHRQKPLRWSRSAGGSPAVLSRAAQARKLRVSRLRSELGHYQVVPAAAFSMHERHKQSRYLLRSSALVSSLNLISVHQQPVARLISQANACPHASHVRALFKTGKILVIDFGSISIISEPDSNYDVDYCQGFCIYSKRIIFKERRI